MIALRQIKPSSRAAEDDVNHFVLETLRFGLVYISNVRRQWPDRNISEKSFCVLQHIRNVDDLGCIAKMSFTQHGINFIEVRTQ